MTNHHPQPPMIMTNHTVHNLSRIMTNTKSKMIKKNLLKFNTSTL
jgi:hypothetical protein